MASDLEPRVIIMDLRMPDGNAITPEEVKSRLSDQFYLLATSFRNDEAAKKLAEDLGAAVLLDKTNLAGTLIPTIMQLSRDRGAAA